MQSNNYKPLNLSNMKFSSIVPSQMSNNELRAMCAELQTAKNWKLDHATIALKNGLDYKVDVTDLEDYQEAYQTECGEVRI